MNPDVVVGGAWIAASETLALRKFRAFTRQHVMDAAIRCVVRDDRHLAAAPATVLARSAGVAQPTAEQVAHRKGGFDRLDICHARNRIGNFAADVDPVAECTRTASAGESLSENSNRQPTPLIGAEHKDREMIGMPHGSRLIGVFVARRQKLAYGRAGGIID